MRRRPHGEEIRHKMLAEPEGCMQRVFQPELVTPPPPPPLRSDLPTLISAGAGPYDRGSPSLSPPPGGWPAAPDALGVHSNAVRRQIRSSASRTLSRLRRTSCPRRACACRASRRTRRRATRAPRPASRASCAMCSRRRAWMMGGLWSGLRSASRGAGRRGPRGSKGSRRRREGRAGTSSRQYREFAF
ncbi:hypothetical protein PsYK624_100670 [Phanerochaete sordida]|uniref:Uncharacterized protein n=1 Tax=Phanerochaete sordida TaxID=48140 RepID=A0A9P3GFH7_9APHY|nr:hypothetical protein PsYK624_100670 [Phanerochaete sordida]